MSQSTPTYSPDQILAAGQRAEEDGNPDFAERFYAYITDHYADSAEALIARQSMSRLALGRFEAANAAARAGDGAFDGPASPEPPQMGGPADGFAQAGSNAFTEETSQEQVEEQLEELPDDLTDDLTEELSEQMSGDWPATPMQPPPPPQPPQSSKAAIAPPGAPVMSLRDPVLGQSGGSEETTEDYAADPAPNGAGPPLTDPNDDAARLAHRLRSPRQRLVDLDPARRGSTASTARIEPPRPYTNGADANGADTNAQTHSTDATNRALTAPFDPNRYADDDEIDAGAERAGLDLPKRRFEFAVGRVLAGALTVIGVSVGLLAMLAALLTLVSPEQLPETLRALAANPLGYDGLTILTLSAFGAALVGQVCSALLVSAAEARDLTRVVRIEIGSRD